MDNIRDFYHSDFNGIAILGKKCIYGDCMDEEEYVAMERGLVFYWTDAHYE